MRRSHRGITDFKIISLLAGGIGIFSVMQISISERTYEIGLRRSIGATDPEILFLAAGFAIVIGLAAGGLCIRRCGRRG